MSGHNLSSPRVQKSPWSRLLHLRCAKIYFVLNQVRDRATLYLAELDGHAGGPQAIDVQWNIPPKNLEKSLRAYLENGTDAPFDLVSPLAALIIQLLACNILLRLAMLRNQTSHLRLDRAVKMGVF
jgi:hypothetical protein